MTAKDANVLIEKKIRNLSLNFPPNLRRSAFAKGINSKEEIFLYTCHMKFTA